MPKLAITDFGGVVPVKGDRALPDNFATISKNTWLYSNELIGLRIPASLLTVNNITEKVFRVPLGTVGGDPADPTAIPAPSYLGDSVWMQFDEWNTDVVRGPIVEDKFKRYYFCSPKLGLRYNTYARMQAGLSAYRAGVPPPPYGPLLSEPVVGSGSKVTRSYVYTFVNEFGEESGPSSFALGEFFANSTWRVTIPAAIPPQSPVSSNPPGGSTPPGLPVLDAPAPYARYMKIHIYRTITSTAGVATYFRVHTFDYTGGGWPAGGTIFFDDNGATNTDEIVSGNLQLETLNYTLPPNWLQGIIAMPNGFLVGWVDSDVYMSEPYQVHAWPVEYTVSAEYPVVGLGVLGTTCVICTQSYPATLSGVKPVVMSFTKSTTHEPCLSRGSIVSTPTAVLYASQNGLISVGPGGLNNVTQDIITRAKWVKDYSPAYLRACRYQNGYLALRAIPTLAARDGFFLDPTSLKVALTSLTDLSNSVIFQSDAFSGEVFLIRGAGPRKVYRWDQPEDKFMPIQWRSKEFQIPNLRNFGAYAIYWDQTRYTPGGAVDPANPYGLEIMPADVAVQFIVWADRRQVYYQTVPKNGEPVRLPSGFKADIWQFEIRARAPVYSLHVGTTTKELGGV